MGSVPIVIGGGTIADIYPPETRGRAMSVYMLSAMMGPPIGPIVGALITQKLGWRWIFGTAAIAVSDVAIPPPLSIKSELNKWHDITQSLTFNSSP